MQKTAVVSQSKKTYTYEEAFKASLEYFGGNEFAASTFLNKYALKNENNELLEKTPDDMHWRIAKEFARIEKKKFKKPFSEEEIYSFIEGFRKIIPQGSPMYAIGNYQQFTSASNCYVVESPYDSYGGICKVDEEMAQISKRRGGVGLDVSNIRPAETITRNAARTSTGVIPFVCRFSNTIREVGQSGRRGAQMQTISIHHPEAVIPWDDEIDGVPFDVQVKNKDLGEYIVSSKYYNPNKVDFATCKYDPKKVTGANISIRLTDEFLNALENDEEFEQRWPIDSKKPQIRKKIKAKKIWDKIIYSAWRTAEPGLLFWDNMIRESPADCYGKFGFSSTSTNPCAELLLSPYDSCRLLLLNLIGFVRNAFTKDAYFDYKEFYKHVQIAQRLMDDLVDLELEYIKRILDKIYSDPEPADIKAREIELWKKILVACEQGRRTGTGVTAVGDTLAALGVPYGSEEGIKIISSIYQTLKFGAYRCSVDMAKELGAFPVWDHDLEKYNPFLNRIAKEKIKIGEETIDGVDIWKDMKKHGRRNIALLTTAPAGTVSCVARNVNSFGTSSGIEPQYSDKPYIRNKKINPGDKNSRTDFIDQNGDHWQKYTMQPSFVEDWMKLTGETDPTKSPWHNNCAEDINWELRVRLQAAANRHVDHSISSTVNLPESATLEDVAKIYTTAWKSGCKGITVYRDKCRTGVLVKDDASKKNATQREAAKRPTTLPCDVYHIKVRGDDFFVLVGMLNNFPYEVFAGKNGMIANVHKGHITKNSRGNYSVLFEDGSVIGNVCDLITDEQAAIARLVSLSLRHGTDIKYVVEQIEKVPGDMNNLAKGIARALKKYIKDGTSVTGFSCPNCQSVEVVRQEGCRLCRSCGWSGCS